MLEELQKNVETLELHRAMLFEKRRPIDEEISLNYDELTKAREQLAEARVADMKEENFVPSPGNWFSEKELELILLGETNSMTLYRHAEWLMNSRFGLAINRNGYYPETEQTAFQIALVKGDHARTKLVKDAILYLLPHLKWHKKDQYNMDIDPYKIRFKILERSLSAGGISYCLVYTTEKKWFVEDRWNKIEFQSLDAALEHIQENVWFERSDGSYDDDY